MPGEGANEPYGLGLPGREDARQDEGGAIESPIAASCSDATDLGLTPEALKKVIALQTLISQAPLSLAGVMQHVVDLLPTVICADGAIIELCQENQLVYSAASGLGRRQLGMRIPVSGSLSGLCVARNEVLVSPDTELDPRVNKAACRAVGFRSMAVFPLRYENRPVGVLKLIKAVPDGFSEEHMDLISLFSDLVAAHISHALTYESALGEKENLVKLATSDSLTGLPNRAAFFDHLRQASARAARQSDSFGVALVDMDHLKPINDIYGHQAGDSALRALAMRIRTSCRATDFPARIGGDEFGILLFGMPEPQTTEGLAEHIASKLTGPIEFQGRELPIEASIGIALAPRDGRDPELLVEKADKAMYRMKQGKKAARS